MSSVPAGPARLLEVLSDRRGVVSGRGEWLGQTVFVKQLCSEDPEQHTIFSHEGLVASRLCHPLIPPLLTRSETQLVFPFVCGHSLRQQVRQAPLSVSAATEVTWGVLQAVAYLHDQGVVHHDLKPENVLLCGPEASLRAVRLIDFGMSHAADLDLDVHSGTRMGTPHFMAPEQFQGVRGDPRSDLYAVGVLLFDCLAGHPPYEDALGWLIGISEERLAAPGPAALHPLLLQALQRDRERRPAAARVMLSQLAAAREQLGLPALPEVK